MKILVWVISMLWMAGCTIHSTISKFDDYAVVPMSNSECSLKSAEVSKSKIAVNVARFDDSYLESNAKKLSREANLPVRMSSRVESLLREAGMETYSGQDKQSKPPAKKMGQKDYVVKGFLDTVELTTVFEEAHKEREYGLVGKKQKVGPKCSYSATVKGNIKIYDDEHRALGNIEIAASQSIAEDTKSEKCSDTPKAVTLVRETAETAVRKAKIKLQNFRPPEGYVLEKRSNGEESIYKVSIGASMGLKPVADVEVWRCYHYTNPLTKQTAPELRLVAKGTVTDQFGSNYSWVRLGEESALQLGDTVKVVYQDSLLHQLGEFTQQLGSGP